jgi:hypothetical protein
MALQGQEKGNQVGPFEKLACRRDLYSQKIHDD